MSEMAGPAAPAATPNTPAATPGVPGQTSVVDKSAQPGAPTQELNQAQQDYIEELKINGQTKKFTREQLKTLAMLGAASTEKFQQASEKERKHQEWKQRASKSAIEALMDPELGLSKEQIREQFENWYKENFIDPETMTKEQREALDWKKRAEAAEKLESERQEQFKKWQEEQQLTAARQQLQQEIIDSLEKSGLPKTRFTASRLAYWKKQNLARGYDAPAEVLIQQVKDEGQSILKAYVAESSPQQIIDFLGEELIQKLRKYDIEQLKSRYQKSGAPSESPAKASKTKGNRSMREVDQWFNDLRRSK